METEQWLGLEKLSRSKSLFEKELFGCAIARSQEGLSPTETIAAYQTLYFPAQRIHLERDQPQQAATAIIPNDG